jgi:hypothetical protein
MQILSQVDDAPVARLESTTKLEKTPWAREMIGRTRVDAVSATVIPAPPNRLKTMTATRSAPPIKGSSREQHGGQGASIDEEQRDAEMGIIDPS